MDGRILLPKDMLLDGSYRIERLIGTGGFGVTYEAEDLKLRTRVALKEYYPADFGERDAALSVRAKSEGHRKTFEWGRSSFLQEAQTLARFKHPSIVRVTRVFEALSTAYMVMDFEEGKSLDAWLRDLGRAPTQKELDRFVAPLLDAIEIMHSADFLHRDIAPDNIIIRADGTPVLLDFGAARRAVAEMTQTITGIVKSGYSPHEQYASDGRLQGPWSDLYAFGATLYRVVTGERPEEAPLRVSDDRVQPASELAVGTYRPSFLSGIQACLEIEPAQRPQSVARLREMMFPPLVEVVKSAVEVQPAVTPASPPRVPRKWWQEDWSAPLSVLLVGAGWWLIIRHGGRAAAWWSGSPRMFFAVILPPLLLWLVSPWPLLAWRVHRMSFAACLAVGLCAVVHTVAAGFGIVALCVAVVWGQFTESGVLLSLGASVLCLLSSIGVLMWLSWSRPQLLVPRPIAELTTPQGTGWWSPRGFVAAATIAVLLGAYGGYEYTQRLSAARELAAARKRQQDERLAAEKRAAEWAQREAERRRLAEAELSRKRAEEEAQARARVEAEARRLAELKRKADEEAQARAREAEARRIEEERSAAEAAAEKARHEATAKEQMKPTPITGTGFVAVLASKKTRTDALNAFPELQEKYRDVLGSATPDVQEVDLGEKGFWYRLIVVPAGPREAAARTCSQLRYAGFPGCWVTAY